VSKRDPHDVLGVRRGAGTAAIKAAFRRLARKHHPDLSGDDAAAVRRATREMVEINAAYRALLESPLDADLRDGTSDERSGPGRPGGPTPDGDRPGERTGPPRPRPTRPVTGRVDTSRTFRPRNQTVGPPGHGPVPRNEPPSRQRRPEEPLRASEPNGPLERARARRRRRLAPPQLDAASAMVIEFGKFHGHTLGEIAVFEPSYIDWLVSTITRDHELVAAARVVRDDLDARGVRRRQRPPRQPMNRAS
jgi:hypothetical protein